MREIEKCGENDMWYVIAFVGGMILGATIMFVLLLAAAVVELSKYQDE